MSTLIACLSTGKGTWTEVATLIQAQPWDNIFLITNQFGKENFKGNAKFVVIDPFQEASSVSSLTQEIKKQLQSKIADFEIALNLASGSGKEHMAVMEAVLELGLSFRLVTLRNNRLEVLGFNP